MSLTLHFHPFSSFCQKVVIALYETGAPFTPNIVDLGDAAQRAALLALWPIGRFPVLRDEAADLTLPESSIIIEYLAQHYPGASKLVPDDPDKARQVRMGDRFYDMHVHNHMQAVIGDRIRPADHKDPFGVEAAKRQMHTALSMIESERGDGWSFGGDYTMADIAASPALFYADKIMPLAGEFPKTHAYLERLKARPSFARTLEEAEPYFQYFPKE